MSEKLLNKYKGTLLGLAVGDALGVPVEFKKVGRFEPITDYRDCEHFPLPAGHWSDDTAMTLCLAYSLLESKGFDPVDQMDKYKKWLSDGYCSSTGKAIGVGQTILRTLLTHQKSDDPYVSVTSIRSDGNGSLMRIAPIPLLYRNKPHAAIENAKLSSKVTHGSTLCSDACMYYTGLIIEALNGASKDDLLSPLYSPVSDFWSDKCISEEVKSIASGSYKNTQPEGTGFVISTLETALWAFHKTSTFEEGILLAINLGNDADTSGAVYGQLAGAFYGIENIPEKYLSRLAKKEEIATVAQKLFDCSNEVV